jgi:hypothetical protein
MKAPPRGKDWRVCGFRGAPIGFIIGVTSILRVILRIGTKSPNGLRRSSHGCEHDNREGSRARVG